MSARLDLPRQPPEAPTVMARVHFTRHLNRFFPELREGEGQAATVAELVGRLDARFPGLAGYLLEDDGSLRKHVNIFVENTLIADRRALSDRLDENSSVYIMQALSGG